MSIPKVITAVLKFFKTTLEKDGRVIEVKANENGWDALIETIEEGEYMRKIAHDDMVAIYEVHVNTDLEVTGYSRKSMRPRKQAVPEI